MRNSLYLPLLGGPRREDIEIIDVSAPDGQASVEVIGDVFRITAGPDLQQLPIGVPFPVIVNARYLDGDGKDVVTAIPVIATNTPAGVALQLPGGQQVFDSGLMSPIAPSQVRTRCASSQRTRNRGLHDGGLRTDRRHRVEVEPKYSQAEVQNHAAKLQ